MPVSTYVEVIITDCVDQRHVYPFGAETTLSSRYARRVEAININSQTWYVGFSAPLSSPTWRVVSKPTPMSGFDAEMPDIAFPTREAAIVYAIMLAGGS